MTTPTIKVLTALRESPNGLRTVELVQITGMSMGSVSNALVRLKAKFFVDGGGSQGVAGIWRATLKSATESTPAEYIQAADIFQVGYRVAKAQGVLNDFVTA